MFSTDTVIGPPDQSQTPRLIVLRLPAETGLLSPLNPAERAIATGIVRGLSNTEIAAMRGTSPRTVANQIAVLFQRVGVQSRAELVRRMFGGGP